MSILIPNMEMPRNCSFCPCARMNISRNGIECSAVNFYAENLMPQKGRMECCPLIELPPHGRLIDRDALTLFGQIATRDAPTIIEAEDSFFNSLKRGLEQAINNDVREITINEVDDDGYFTEEERKLIWDVIDKKSQKTGININDIIDAEGKDADN